MGPTSFQKFDIYLGGKHEEHISVSDVVVVVGSSRRSGGVGVSRTSAELFCLVGTNES